MKKAVCLLMICLLVLFFGLGSDAIAKKKKKKRLKITKAYLVGTEWEIKGTGRDYDCDTGEYLGSMVGGIGLAVFGDPEATGTVAPMVSTDMGVVAGARADYILDDYTVSANTVRSDSGSVEISAPGVGVIEEYEGPIDAVFKFTKNTIFTGTVQYTDDVRCVETIINVSGRMLGRFPAD